MKKVMDEITQDLLKNKSLINLAIEFINSREYLKSLKLTHKKHLIGAVMPNIELISAAGGYPVFPIRMLPFGESSLLHAISLGKTLLGGDLFGNIFQFISKLDSTNTISKLIQDLIDGIFNQYNQVFQLGVDREGIPTDECYGIKVMSGIYSEKGKNLSGTFHSSIRCSTWEKSYETWSKFAPAIFIDIPPYDTPENRQLALKEVIYASERLEQIIGQSVTNNSLRKIAEITNECKDYSWKIIQLALGDYIPLHPVSMAEILALIEICFQDYLSDPARFRDILKQMYLEMDMNVRNKQNVYDARKLKRIFFTPRFGGWEHQIENFAFENGGRVVYADWFLYGFMNKIKTTGDMFENYAEYLLKLVIDFGCNNKNNVENIMKIVRENNIDGVIYNQLFGCHSVSTAYTRLKKKLIVEGIPSTMISFNNVGENVEQTKTRVVALMELLK